MEKRTVLLPGCLPTRLEEILFLFIENGKSIYSNARKTFYWGITNLES